MYVCMMTASEKTSLKSTPSQLIYLDMHQHYEWIKLFLFCIFSLHGEATDMGYFASSKFSKSLVHKENFSLI